MGRVFSKAWVLNQAIRAATCSTGCLLGCTCGAVPVISRHPGQGRCTAVQMAHVWAILTAQHLLWIVIPACSTQLGLSAHAPCLQTTRHPTTFHLACITSQGQMHCIHAAGYVRGCANSACTIRWHRCSARSVAERQLSVSTATNNGIAATNGHSVPRCTCT